MYCKYCGIQLPDDAEFCSNCGLKLNMQKNSLSSVHVNGTGLKLNKGVVLVAGIVFAAITVFFAIRIHDKLQSLEDAAGAISVAITGADTMYEDDEEAQNEARENAYLKAKAWLQETENDWFDGATKQQRQEIVKWVKEYEIKERIVITIDYQ